jgi:thioredoxin reductase (NADPH)
MIYDVVIIGGGPGGYSAAIYAKRFNLSTLVITRERGGLVTKTHLIENWPGEKSITGFDLAQKIEDHATSLGVEIIDTEVLEITKENLEIKKDITKENNNHDIFKIKTSQEQTFQSKTIIIATGTNRRKLNVKGEDEFYGKGVSYCATCDAGFFKNKIVGMVGGSDSAVKEAIYLTEFANKVYIIYRKETPRAEPYNMKLLNEKIKEGKIEIINNANVIQILGTTKLTHVILDKSFQNSRELTLDGLFVEIGADANVELAKQLSVKLNEKNEIIIDKNSITSDKAIFACGDVVNSELKQAITASAEGVRAAYSAHEYLQKNLRC